MDFFYNWIIYVEMFCKGIKWQEKIEKDSHQCFVMNSFLQLNNDCGNVL